MKCINTMQVRLIIKKKLEEKFNPYQLNVIDESHLHEGHVGAKPEGETHFKVEMKSNKFLGLSLIHI